MGVVTHVMSIYIPAPPMGVTMHVRSISISALSWVLLWMSFVRRILHSPMGIIFHALSVLHMYFVFNLCSHNSIFCNLNPMHILFDYINWASAILY